MKRTVIFDLDGTLADCSHRRHLVDMRLMAGGEKAFESLIKGKNWPEFKRLAYLDPVYENIRELLNSLAPWNYIVLCTGRNESQRAATEEWLRKNDISYAKMYMRADEDYRADHITKRELLDQIRADGYTPWLAVDDRDSVVAMWREAGLTCLQCAPGDY